VQLSCESLDTPAGPGAPVSLAQAARLLLLVISSSGSDNKDKSMGYETYSDANEDGKGDGQASAVCSVRMLS
jgi:hypothetical protein